MSRSAVVIPVGRVPCTVPSCSRATNLISAKFPVEAIVASSLSKLDRVTSVPSVMTAETAWACRFSSFSDVVWVARRISR